jgi:hypothetical protein
MTTQITSNKTAIRYTKQQLISMNTANKTTPLQQPILNKLMGLRITLRTWKEKTEKIRIHNRKRKHQPSKATNTLPSLAIANVQSINNKTDLINRFLQDSNVDILCLSETWLEHNAQIIINELNPNLYHFINNQRNEQKTISLAQRLKGGGGLLTIIKKSYSNRITIIEPAPYSYPVWLEDKISQEDDKIEFQITRIYPKRLPRGYTSCFIVNVYLPDWGNKQKHLINKLINSIEPSLTKLTSNGIPMVFVVGDLNGANVQQIKTQLKLTQINHKPTINNKCYDIILTNSPACYKVFNLPPFGKSPHQIVSIKPIKSKYKSKTRENNKTLVRTGKIKDTVAKLRTHNWETISYNTNNPQSAFDSFYSTISEYENYCQPLKSKLKIGNDKPWMTSEIKAKIKQRQKLYYDATVNGTETYANYEKLANEVDRLIKSRKFGYNRRFTLTSTNWWEQINNVRNNQEPNDLSKKQANQLNKGFHSVWHSTIQPDISSFIQIDTTKPEPQIFNYQNVSHELSRMKIKSAGPDGLSPKLIKAARLELIDPIISLLNFSIENAFVPEQWKKAYITPIPKVPHPTTWKDHRPINNLACLDKLAQRIIVKFIIKETKQIWIDNNQYGFLPNRCTMDAIIQVIEDWGSAKDKHKALIAIFFDFEKAFDLVDHEILLKKLQQYLPAWLISWIAAYLTDRYQQIKLRNLETDWMKVEAGVVQGSVIGPILFILFISDINKYIPPEVTISKYADDILNYIIGNHEDLDNSSIPQAVAKGVTKWCKLNKMRLNVSKCKVISNCKTPPSITINKQQLDVVNTYKYLGILLSHDLDWKDQSHRVQNIISSVPHLIKQLKRVGFREEILITVYRSLALSHINYSAPILTSVNKETTAQLETYQNRILRIIGITLEQANEKYKLPSIATSIDTTCNNLLKRILAEETHPLTLKLPKNEYTHNKNTIFRTSVAKTTAYANSFVQKHLKIIRDGTANLYFQKNTVESANIESKQTTNNQTQQKTKTVCPYCNSSFIVIKTHLRMNKACNAASLQISQISSNTNFEITFK